MNNIEPTPEAIAATDSFLQRLKDKRSQWQRENKNAWAALTKLGSSNLLQGDEVVIAKHIYAELPRLKKELKKQGRTLGKFCFDAGLTAQGGEYSKELHRLMLAPDADPAKVRPRRTASKYKNLIAEMANTFKENRSNLAERMLRDTTLHSGGSEQRNEAELIKEFLQLTVDTLDAEFGWSDTYQETAQLKAAHTKEGGDCRWPQYEASYRTGMYGWTNDGMTDQEKSEIERSAAITERKISLDVNRAYWEKDVTQWNETFVNQTFESWTYGPTPSGCLQDDSFFYVPHAYLGYGEGICNPIDTTRGAEHLKNELEKQKAYFLGGATPKDDWDDAEQCPKGQTSSLPNAEAHYHAWLIAYPAPDNSGLMPMLYMAVEECGPTIVPLDAVTLSALRSLYWFGADGRIATFLERIKELIGANAEGTDFISQQLRNTAPWLQKNPFFKIKHKNIVDREFLENKIKNLSAQNS